MHVLFVKGGGGEGVAALTYLVCSLADEQLECDDDGDGS